MAETVEKTDPTTVRITISINWEDFTREYQKALRKIGEGIRVRGFRPGKAPSALIEKIVGREVKLDTAAQVVGAKLEEVIAREKIHPLRKQHQISEKVVIEEGSKVVWSDEVEVWPEVEKITFEGFEVSEEEVVNEEMVLEEIKTMAARMAPLARRPDEEGAQLIDIVVVSGKVKAEKGDSETLALKEEKIDLAPWSQLPAGLTTLFVGKKVGDRIESPAPFPFRGEVRPAIVSLRVEGVLKRQVPNIDDELARDHDYGSLEEMKEDVRRRLQELVHETWLFTNSWKILDQLASRMEVPLPRTFRSAIEEEGKALQCTVSEEDFARLRAQLEREAKRYVLVKAVAIQNGIQLPEEEVQKSIEKMRGMLGRLKWDDNRRMEFLKEWGKEYQISSFLRLVYSFIVQKAREAKRAPL